MHIRSFFSFKNYWISLASCCITWQHKVGNAFHEKSVFLQAFINAVSSFQCIYYTFFLPITFTIHKYFSQSFISGTFDPLSQVSNVLNRTQLDSWVHRDMLFVEYNSLWSILYGSVSSQWGWDWWQYLRIRLRKLWTKLFFLQMFMYSIRVDDLFICISSFSPSIYYVHCNSCAQSEWVGCMAAYVQMLTLIYWIQKIIRPQINLCILFKSEYVD